MLVITAGCAGGQAVTPEAVAQAKRLWTQANIRDYDLDWSVRGPNNAHYAVTVRGGEVRKIESIQRDGGKVELHPGDPYFFGVDGLFHTIDDELALRKTDHPFGQPKGTRVAMRFLPDARLGLSALVPSRCDGHAAECRDRGQHADAHPAGLEVRPSHEGRNSQ